MDPIDHPAARVAASVSILLFSCLSNHAAAAEASGAGQFVVAGAAVVPEFDGSADGRLVPLVIANLDVLGTRVEIEGIQSVTVDLVRHPVWRAGPAFGAQLPRNDDADEPRVAELPEVDFAVEVGAFVGFERPIGNLPEGRLSGDLTVRRDVTNAHDGVVIKADLDYFFSASRRVRYLFGINATYANDAYQDTYFSVSDATSLQSGLPTFNAGAGLKDVGAEASMILSFSPQRALFLRAAYNRLLGDAGDSPIVRQLGSEDQIFIGGGVFFRF